jgi:hypothetical protein
MQIPINKLLTELVMSLLGAIEGQKQAMNEQKQAHANQMEALTRTFTEQFDTLRSEIATIQAHLSNIQIPLNVTPSYADVARTPPSSRPTNLTSLSSTSRTPSMATDKLYCTVDTSRVEEEDLSKVQPAAVRQAIEKEMRTMTDQSNWRCTTVIKDPRNTARIRVTCRDETELQLVKQAAEKIAAPGVRVLRDQLYPVNVDNANRIIGQPLSTRMQQSDLMRQRYWARKMRSALLK